MKRFQIFLNTLFLLVISMQGFTQVEVILSINQPPEFGFEIINQDTTIVRGDSITLGTDLIVFGGSGDYLYSWSSGVTLNDSTVINPIAFPDDSTTYVLTVIDANGCSFAIDYKVNVRMYPVNVPSVKLQNQFLTAKLFPNPNDGKFKIELTGEPQDEINLYIIDSSGRTIQKKVVNNFIGQHAEAFELELSSGIYTLLIDSEVQRLQRQFIIQ